MINFKFLDDLSELNIVIYLYVKESFGSSKALSQALYNLGNLTMNDQYNYVTLYFEEIKVEKKY